MKVRDRGTRNIRFVFWLLILAGSLSLARERTVVSLRDFSTVELKSAGIEVSQKTVFHVKALGAGGGSGWTSGGNEMFAYAWIINGDTRSLVWKMDFDNTSKERDDREFDGQVTLETGSYEVYFAACTFKQHTTFTDFNVNVDHRETPLFGGTTEHAKGFFDFFKRWWSDDIEKAWGKRSPKWGIDLFVDEAAVPSITSFTPPKKQPSAIFSATALGDLQLVRQGFTLSSPTTLDIYAVGEAKGDHEMVDGGWIVNAADRSRVWEMEADACMPAGGARKNVKFSGQVALKKGDYVLYYYTDDSHSMADWNDSPPEDPLHWGITLSMAGDKSHFRLFPYKEDQNVIISMTKVKDDEDRSEGFTLKQESKIRIYCIGERSNSRRLMADYGLIIDAKTRSKVWTMDVDRTLHAGGASKNRLVDEIISLPRGNYIVTYTTDDSHAYGDWNMSPPFDPEHYGITVMGVGEKFSNSLVTKFVEQRDKSVIAQIIRVGDDADKEEQFKLDRTTRVRIYAIGEAQGHEMVDYGWIEDAKTGDVIWEMAYGMTFHAGGGRKNRMVNTTFLLDRGEYKLHYRSDDSHSYGNWNSEPPEDQQYYGITLYRDEGGSVPPMPPDEPGLRAPPLPPKPPTDME